MLPNVIYEETYRNSSIKNSGFLFFDFQIHKYSFVTLNKGGLG